jgi:hypothetical protein
MKKCIFLFASILVLTNMVQAAIPLSESAVAVGTSSTEVVPANADRRFLLLINDSDTVIYCSLTGTAAVVNQGTRLNANGGNLLLDTAVPGTAINCIHGGAGNKTLLRTEEQ